MDVAVPYQTVNLTLPHTDMNFLRTLSKKMGWNVRAERKNGKLYHAKNSEDLVKQILG